jgi:RimJ/RimL family protein N-acetyltransferase
MPQHSLTLVSQTGRVKLVPPNSDEDAAVAELRSHPENMRYLRFLPSQISVNDARLRREQNAEDPAVMEWYIHVVGSDGISSKFIGSAILFKIDIMHNSCEAGLIVSHEWHRGGYATEALRLTLGYAFDERKFHRVTFETSEKNEAMKGWLENALGATLEATRRDAWRENDGKYTNVCSYSLLGAEWEGGARERLDGLVVRKRKAALGMGS